MKETRISGYSSLKGAIAECDFELKMGPGLYVIWNTAINKFYVGQSNNVPARLSSHWRELEIRRHECRLMQEH
jgi:hypothetical protein